MQLPTLFSLPTVNSAKVYSQRAALLLKKLSNLLIKFVSCTELLRNKKFFFFLRAYYFIYLFNYIRIYNYLYVDVYLQYLRDSFLHNQEFFFFFTIFAKKNKLFLILSQAVNTPLFFLTTGFFQKLLQKPKKYRKTKTVRLLMLRHVRKMLIILNQPALIIISLYKPLFINEALFFFNQKFINKFYNPLINNFISEDL